MNPYPKSKQLAWNKVDKPKVKHKRNAPRLRDRGRVRPEVYQAAYERAGGCCERCGYVDGSIDPSGQRWGLEAAHIVRRRHLDETTVEDIVMLCGPSVNTGTCHNFADYSRAGRNWLIEYGKYLRKGA